MAGNTVNLFDHIKEPYDQATVEGALHILKLLPVIGDSICNIIIEKLDNQGLFKGALKHDLNFIANKIKAVTTPKYKEWDKDVSDEGGRAINFAFDLSDKIAGELVKYVERIVLMQEPERYNTDSLDLVANKAQFLFKLNPGDQFIFVDEQEYAEYTYEELKQEDNEWICYYVKINTRIGENTIRFREPNIYRPILNTSIIFK